MLEYTRIGSGRPLVLIHGLLSSPENWRYVLPELARRFDVITVSLPGHGGAPVIDGVETIGDIVTELAATLDSIGIDRATWVGHSWGGYVVSEAIAAIPDRLDAAVLVYSSPYADSDEARQRRDVAIARTEAEPMPGIVRDLVPLYFAPSDPRSAVDAAVDVADQVPPEGLRFALRSIRDRRDNVQAILDRPQLPVLILEGELDTAIPRIEFTADNVTVIRTGSSHCGPTTEPQVLLDALLPWLARHGTVADA